MAEITEQMDELSLNELLAGKNVEVTKPADEPIVSDQMTHLDSFSHHISFLHRLDFISKER